MYNILIIFLCLVHISNSQLGDICTPKGYTSGLENTIVHQQCNYNHSPKKRYPTCCSAIGDTSELHTRELALSRGIGWEPTLTEKFLKKYNAMDEMYHCEIKKVYQSSPEEIRHMEAVSLFKNMSIRDEGIAVYKFVNSEEQKTGAMAWLERVKVRMSTDKHVETNEVDREYLSRYAVTKTCYPGTPQVASEAKVSHWYEYIEPLTLHNRGPRTNTLGGPDSFFSTDYVLLHSGRDEMKRIWTRKQMSVDEDRRRVSFNQVFAWEMTLLDPSQYWSEVPSLWVPYWHFFNTPIQSHMTDDDSPLYMIQSMAQKEDFVSFKLDVDHSDTELPILLDLLSNHQGITELVDEFFFEFHFKAREMAQLWQTGDMPTEHHGLTLRRHTVMNAFLKLRRAGVRAHIWV